MRMITADQTPPKKSITNTIDGSNNIRVDDINPDIKPPQISSDTISIPNWVDQKHLKKKYRKKKNNKKTPTNPATKVLP